MRLFKMKKEKINVGYCVRCKWTAEGTYCKKCGKEMFPAFHDCPKCGKAVHIADNFCGFCGADLDLLDKIVDMETKREMESEEYNQEYQEHHQK